MIKELFRVNEVDYTAKIQDSKINSVRSREITQTGCRVFLPDGRMGMSATEGKCGDELLWRKAKEATGLGFTYNYELEKNKKFNASKGDPEILNLDFVKEFTQQFLKEATKLSRKFIISNQVKSSLSEVNLTNSLGLDLSSKKTILEVELLVKKKGSPNIIDVFLPFYFYTKPNLNKILEDLEKVYQLITLEEIGIEEKKINVAFWDNAILRKFYNNINGESYQRGISLLSGKKGEKIFSDKINLIQKPIYDQNFVFKPFDHEGYIHTQNKHLIRNGVLETILYDKQTAARYNEKSTGNGFRSFSSNPAISSLPAFLDPTTDQNLEEFASELTFIPLFAEGGDFLPNGNYSTPVQLGVLIKNGKIVGRPKQCIIKGNYLKALNEDLVGVVKNDFMNMFNGNHTVVSRMDIVEN